MNASFANALLRQYHYQTSGQTPDTIRQMRAQADSVARMSQDLGIQYDDTFKDGMTHALEKALLELTPDCERFETVQGRYWMKADQYSFSISRLTDEGRRAYTYRMEVDNGREEVDFRGWIPGMTLAEFEAKTDWQLTGGNTDWVYRKNDVLTVVHFGHEILPSRFFLRPDVNTALNRANSGGQDQFKFWVTNNQSISFTFDFDGFRAANETLQKKYAEISAMRRNKQCH